ncbi:APC family permease [Embleya sp. NBC_00896]|uniref:APC family permease n=1 Tax=Embleya sp. NBC_00896 TaxID=2975961 RepID=UPI003863B9C3|nr:APC family permease [Embleya sp. NBC_00896]
MPATLLPRRLGLADAILIGLGAMIGAGVFVAFAPAARAAGEWLPAALVVAAGVAYCNATSSARLAARYPQAGGTYVYGRERLGAFWGYLAGWGFVVGKTASCAAMALTVGAYAWPAHARSVAMVVVVALTVLNRWGVQKAAWVNRVIVAVVLAVLALVVAVSLTRDRNPFGGAEPGSAIGVRGVLEAAGLLFFAFAGYARITTLGEEVRDPARTIPRAVPIALAITLAVYTLVGWALLARLGPADLAASSAPLADAVPDLAWVVRIGATLAAAGALLALILGVSRTVLAMARDRHLPTVLAAVHPRHGVPHQAELAVGAVVVALVAVADLRGVIGFSSFAVLTYYAIANASAWTLGRRVVPILGLIGCVTLAVCLPIESVAAGAAVLAVGTVVYAVRRR